jgi:hypothetical protein
MAVSRAPVLPEQFEIDANGITHTPTGYTLGPHGTVNKGRLDDSLEDFNPDAVEEMARRLLLKHLRDNKKT